VTAAGVSAGIDLALTLVGRQHGDLVAQAIQLGIEYDPQPPYDSGAPSKAPDDVRELVTGIMRDAEAALVEEPVTPPA
jgi:transcriptional regulator GlxA family with amidase domain